MTRRARLPDFAGVALVDILANGLAMLIIVIVLSIAARAEREERTRAQVDEVETMMSRRFSTSLVLNSLAASPPARLHDYDNSPLDLERDPQILPIIELHRNFVRELYSGAVWSREALLREPNEMDAYLANFSDDQKARLRADVYDIAQFYLAMDILRDHGITIRHWHFLAGGGMNIGAAGACPPGVEAKDCGGGDGGGAGEGDGLSELALGGDGNGSGDGGESWPPTGFGDGDTGSGGSESAPLPGGAALGAVPGEGQGGGGESGGEATLGAGSFPNARPGLGSSRGLLGGGQGQGQAGAQTRFRLSSPESLREQAGGINLSGEPPTPAQTLAVLLDFIGDLQATLDAGKSPAALLANFDRRIQNALANPPTLDAAGRELLRYLLVELDHPHPLAADEALPVTTLADADTTALIVETNRRLRSVAVAQAGDVVPPDAGRAVLRLNAHPDIWRGLSVPLEANGLLMMPPNPQRADELRWRAVAYIAPNFDDFIIGFAFASVAADGRLVVQAEDNRVRLGGHPLTTPYREALFGSRTWLVTLYAALVLALLGLLLVRRLTAERVIH